MPSSFSKDTKQKSMMCTGKYRLGFEASTGGGYSPVRKISECHFIEVDITFECQTIYIDWEAQETRTLVVLFGGSELEKNDVLHEQ